VPGDFRTWFGEQIVDHDLTVTTLANMLDVYDGTVEDWVAGRSLPTAEQCHQLAELFEASPQYIMRLAGHRP
jgi:plasmid maintenance system antidote protein VapI